MAEEQKNNSKINKLKEILPILWSSYEHMFAVRENGVKNSINFLLIIVTFLPAVCLALYDLFESPLFLVPILFLVASLLILLKSFFIKGQIPWLELKDTLNLLDDNSFEVDLFSTLKAAESSSWRVMIELDVVVKRSLFLLIFSIFLISLASIFVYFKGDSKLYAVTILLISIFVLFGVFYKDVQRFDLTNEREEFKGDIERWLKGGKGGVID